MKKFIVLLISSMSLCLPQPYKRLIANTNSFDATAFNNSHKIAVKNAASVNDTIHAVYQSSDSLFYVISTNEGRSWLTPEYFSRGKYPGIDIDRLGRIHIVYEYPDTSAGTNDIYYDCLSSATPPLRINNSNRIANLPDLVVDSNLITHIVWQENINNKRHIYYRNYYMGRLSDTVRLSSYSSPTEDNTNPSISIYLPNKRIYVVWGSVDSNTTSPFRIIYRYNEYGNWSGITILFDHYRTLRNPSLDYSHGTDILSVCWEDSSTGNLEARFYGGNIGGSYSTFGLSRFPVISTVGSTWSYYYWDEDSLGFRDIYYHFYYEMTGWYGRSSIRRTFSINESVRYPSACGAYVIWTQGDASPYKIYFANFGYPVKINETLKNENYEFPIVTVPNPFSDYLQIRCQIADTRYQIGDGDQGFSLAVYDASGRVVKSFNPASSIVWSGDDNYGKVVPAGVYFIKITNKGKYSVLPVIRIE